MFDSKRGPMLRYALSVAAAVLVFAGQAPVAQAHVKHSVETYHKHYKAAKVRYGGRKNLGYWRPGPERGPRFGFSSYRGDPFGDDDYYEGRGGRCYYVHHSNYCVANHIFTGFD